MGEPWVDSRRPFKSFRGREQPFEKLGAVIVDGAGQEWLVATLTEEGITTTRITPQTNPDLYEFGMVLPLRERSNA